MIQVPLAPDLEGFIREQVNTGRYHSPEEVVSEALRLLRDRTTDADVRLADLRRDLAIGIEQLDRGESATYASGQEIADRIERLGRERMGRSESH